MSAGALHPEDAFPPSSGALTRGRTARLIWAGIGIVFTTVGFLGYLVPGLPGTVFLIMAAWCFSRSSPRLERWLLGLPGVGRLISDHQAGLGMPRRAKIMALTMIVVAVSISVVFGLTAPAARIGVVALGLVGLWYVGTRVPTRESVLAARNAEP